MTSWVVSSISVWLVPVYIGAMVLIFAVPRTNRPKPAREDEAGESSSGEDPTASSSVDAEPPANVDSSPPAPAAEAEAPPEAAPPKPRKRRVRAKKTAKGAPALDDAPASGRVTWVRVGPGKFVRSVVPVAEFVGPPAPASITVAEPQPSSESPSTPDDPPSALAPEPGPDGEPCRDLLMDQDDSARVDEAPEGPVSSELPEAADAAGDGFAIEQEPEREPSSPDVSEAIAEEHGNAPSTLGEDSDIVPDPEASQDEEPSSVVASLPAAEVVVEVEVEPRETAEMRAPERSSPVGLVDSPTMEAPSRRPRLGLFFSASLRRPRRTVEPAAAVPSRRLGNVRRSGAARRATLAGRAVETRVRQYADDVRGRRANVKRDFHPRSPPARS